MSESSHSGRILRRKEVERLIGLSRSTIYEGIAQGDFPRPIRIGKRAVGWPEATITAWLAKRAALSGVAHGSGEMGM